MSPRVEAQLNKVRSAINGIGKYTYSDWKYGVMLAEKEMLELEKLMKEEQDNGNSKSSREVNEQ